MAHHSQYLAARKDRWKQPLHNSRGEPPPRITKPKAQQPLRRSARLISKHIEQRGLAKNQSTTPSTKSRKRSRSHEGDKQPGDILAPQTKRPRRSSDFHIGRTIDQARHHDNGLPTHSIEHWRRHLAWPKEYFESNSTMSHLVARRKQTFSLRRKRSDSGSLATSSNTPSDQKPREQKSAPYQDPRYKTLLETKGTYMNEDREGPQKQSKDFCQRLLARQPSIPRVSRFSDNVFKSTCSRIDGRNEAKVIQDISRLVVPSGEEFADFGSEALECLVESVNEGWDNSVPLTGTRPQPDYSVGFKRAAFTESQLDKLSPFIGDFISGDQSYFMATYYMYFPFLTCEVKCGAAALDIADRQNAHSMTLAVRAIVELFRLVGREKEVNREILAFSVSHDNRSVRMYGHYAVINGPDTTFYRHPIRTFDFTELDGREKWTAYRFTRNVYDLWVPSHFKRICSAIDEIPSNINFDIPPLSEGSILSQTQSEVEHSSQLPVVEPDITPNTSFTSDTAKRSKRRGARTK